MAKKKTAPKKKKEAVASVATSPDISTTFDNLVEALGVPENPDDAISAIVRNLSRLREISEELQNLRPFLGAMGFDLKLEKDIVEATACIKEGVEGLSSATSGYFSTMMRSSDIDCDDGI